MNDMGGSFSVWYRGTGSLICPECISIKVREWTAKERMDSMYDLRKAAKQEIEQLWSSVAEGKHIKTGDIRKLSAKLFRKIPTKDINSVFALCEQLLEEHNWELGVIAFDWAFRMKSSIIRIHM